MATAPAPRVVEFVAHFKNAFLDQVDETTAEELKYKVVIKVAEVEYVVWFDKKEPALRFRDLLTLMQFHAWSFDAKEEINIWKNF